MSSSEQAIQRLQERTSTDWNAAGCDLSLFSGVIACKADDLDVVHLRAILAAFTAIVKTHAWGETFMQTHIKQMQHSLCETVCDARGSTIIATRLQYPNLQPANIQKVVTDIKRVMLDEVRPVLMLVKEEGYYGETRRIDHPFRHPKIVLNVRYLLMLQQQAQASADSGLTTSIVSFATLQICIALPCSPFHLLPL